MNKLGPPQEEEDVEWRVGVGAGGARGTLIRNGSFSLEEKPLSHRNQCIKAIFFLTQNPAKKAFGSLVADDRV